MLVLLLGTAASSVLGTQAHQSVSAAAMAVVAAGGAFLGVVIVFGLPRARPANLAAWLVPLVAGAGGFALSPWLVMVNRYTDAPPGSEVLFLTTASWGALLAIAVALPVRERLSRVGGALLALAGAAALVANWERPSSFSLFVRYLGEELQMLAAGVVWVLLVLVLLRAARRGSLGVAALSAALGGVLGAGVLAGVGIARGTLSAADFSGGGFWGYGIAISFATVGMLVILRSATAEAIAGAYLLVPASVSLILIAEWVIGPLGPQPMILDAVVAAAVSTLAGVVILWGIGPHARSRRVSAPGGLRRLVAVAGVLLAVLALASALVSLAAPTMTAAVNGLRTDGSQFRASFDLYGYEVAGPWLALGMAVIVLGIAVERSPVRSTLARVLALAGAAGAWWIAADTPLRTLTTFIPSDVQVDYGSEFARIDFTGDPTLWAMTAVGGALVAVGLTLAGRAGARAEDDEAETADPVGEETIESRGDRS
jgi:hypothetical protein